MSMCFTERNEGIGNDFREGNPKDLVPGSAEPEKESALQVGDELGSSNPEKKQ